MRSSGLFTSSKGWGVVIPRGARVCLVSEPRAFRAAGRAALAELKKRQAKVSTFMLPAGEKAKTWASVEKLLSFMLREGLGRDAFLVAAGGGAVTDSAGFAAAIYLRGIPWVSYPTTALGQLDAGLGGKTGINLPEGKNLAGAFHEPAAVVCDAALLAGLPPAELAAGLAEALKIGLVFEPALWRAISGNWLALASGRAPKPLEDVVRRTASWKLRVVAKDPYETAGARELLNFGHTVGHALESAAGYGRLRHGEAVVWGMRAALRLSIVLCSLPLREADAVEGFLEKISVPLPRLPAGRVMTAMKKDKKARGGVLRLVLLKGLGRPVTLPVDARLVRKVVEDLR